MKYADIDRLEVIQEKENRRKGIIISIGIHALILILFFFIKLHSNITPPFKSNEIIVMDFRERGSTPDLGNTTKGQGDGNNGDPLASENPNNTPPKPVEATKPIITKSKPVAATKPIVTTNDVTAPKITKAELDAIKKKEADAKAKAIADAKAKAEADKKKAEQKAFQDKMNAGLTKGKQGSEGQGNNNSQGQTGQTGGDNGVPNGNPDGSGIDPGKGGAIDGLGSFDLGSRKMIKITKYKNECSKIGKIVIRIKVDKFGNVLYAEYTAKNSTSANSCLIELAKKHAYSAKFDSSPQSMEEQWGTIPFNFKN